MMSTMTDKIIQSLVEGKFLKKVIQKIDNECARMSRFLLSSKTKTTNNKIIFMTSQRKYMCNPKYIAEEIRAQKLPYDLVWVTVKDIDPQLPEDIRRVVKNSYQFYKEAASAKIWIDNSINFFFQNTPKKRDQVLISTWHGSLGFKRIGKEDNKDLKWLKKAERCNKETNYCISNSTFESNIYRDTFWQEPEILEFGHPRNDILLTKNKDKIKYIKNKVYDYYNIPYDYKIALYAPTFRDSHNIDCYNIDYQRLIVVLEEKFGGKWKVLARHHFVLRNDKKAKESIDGIEGVIQSSDYVDMQELMLAVDIGITDYSSWLCDFVLTRKPGFIFATDIAEYNTERGLYYPLETTPFPIATNNDELMKNVLDFDINKYKSKIEEFLIDKGCIEDGNASKRVVEKIKEIMGEE